MEHTPIPHGWDPAAPRTWRFVSEVAVRIPVPGPDPGAHILARREVVTAAAEHGHPDDPALRLGMVPERAAGWWGGILAPIHGARVAALLFGDALEEALDEERPPWESLEGEPIGAEHPRLPGLLEERAAAAQMFLDALGLPREPGRA